MATRKATFDLEGCEKKIRSACASELTQRDWCDLWAKAKTEGMKGRTALLALLLPIVARKMPESKGTPDPLEDPHITDADRQALQDHALPHATA